jgi:O-antigen ligase
VHNAYLGVWAESGTFALLCYLGIFVAAILKAWSCAKSRSRFISLMGIGVSLAIVSLCIQMNTGTFYMRSITLFTWLLVALAASLQNLEGVQDHPALVA